jgi:hypothetical protein
MNIANFRVAIGGNLTRMTIRTCESLGINQMILDVDLVQVMRTAVTTIPIMSEKDTIRRLRDDFRGRPHLQSHLAFVFGRRRSFVTKVTSDSSYGSKPMGRRRLLTAEEEDKVVEHVKLAHKRGRCEQVSEITAWINEELLEDERMVSASYFRSNVRIMEKLQTKKPQVVDSARIDANKFDNFIPFFEDLNMLLASGQFVPDLIVNVDETATDATERKAKVDVVCHKDVKQAATRGKEAPEEHVTLCCGVSASGRRTKPVFIIKNKTASTEAALSGEYFQYGEYGLQCSANGWQDSVSSDINKLYIQKYSFYSFLYAYHAMA